MNVAAIVVAAVGVAFSLTGAVGILRMPDTYARVQCATKAVTMGALPVLVAIVLARGLVSAFAARALAVALLITVLNAASAHALVRAAYRRGVTMWSGAVVDQAAELADDRERVEHADGGRSGRGGER